MCTLSCAREGQAWLEPRPGEEVTELQELLAPLQRATKLSKEQEARVDPQVFRERVDQPLLWTQGQDHDAWLTRLVLALLGCFG